MPHLIARVSAMAIFLRNTWPLLLGMLLIMLGNGLQGTLLGVRGAIENMDPSTLGYVMSGYFIGFLGGSQITPLLLRRVGHVRVFAALGSLVSAAFILYAAWVHPLGWMFLRFVVGFCMSGIYVVAESWLNDAADNQTRGKALSLYLIVQMAGIVLGQVLLNLADPAGYALFVLICVLVSLSFAPILLTATATPVFETSRPMTLIDLYKASPLGCIGMFALGGVFAAVFGMSAVYATARGMSIGEVSTFITAIYIGGMVLQYPIGWLSDRLDRRWLIIGVTTTCSLACVAVNYVDNTFTALLVIAFILGGTSNPLYSLLIAYTNDFLENDQMAAASGGMIFINGVGAMASPVIVGAVMAQVGPNGFFGFIGLLMIAVAVYGLYRMTQRATVDETGPFVMVPSRMSPVAVEIATEIAIEEAESGEEDPQQPASN
ncbi:MAG: MFS transporter [Pseudomonadota bacterium]